MTSTHWTLWDHWPHLDTEDSGRSLSAYNSVERAVLAFPALSVAPSI